MDSADSNSFDKLWYCFSNSMSMEQLLEFALTSKVILSYEIDYLNSFHDRLMQGLWKRSSNGCFYKMDDRHEKLAYILLNENYEADFEKSLEKLRNMSFVHKVHDEMSEPSLSSNQNQYVALVDENAIVYENDEMKACEDNIDISEVLGNPLGSVLTVGTESADTILEQTVECEHVTHTRSEQIEIEGLYPKFGLTGEIHAALEDQTACNWIEDAQFSNAQEVFDKMPQLSFCKVISLKEKVAKDDYEHELELNANQDDFLDQKRQMIAKLGALEGPYFWYMVIMCGSWERFFILQSVLSMGSLPSDQFHADEELYDGNLTQNWPHLQVKNALPSTRYRYESVVKPLMLGDFDRFMGLCFSMVLGAEIFIASKFELEGDWRAILNFKEVHSWSDLPLSCDYVILGLIMGSNFRDPVKMALTLALCKYWHILTLDSYACHHFVAMKKSIHLGIVQLGLCNDSPRMSMFSYPRTISGSCWLLLSYTLEDKGDFRGKEDKVYSLEVFDPGGECLGMICEGLNYVFTSSLNRLSSKCDEGIEAQFKIFYQSLMLANVATSKPIAKSNNYVPLPCDHACIGSDNKLSFQMKNYDLKGMKMIKITRFGQSYLAIRWRMSNLICIMNHLATSGSILMTMTCSSLCFDPGGLQNKFCVVILIVLLMRVAACIESTSVWIFDPGEIDDLSGPTSIMSILYLVYGVGINSDGTMYLMFFFHHENDLFQGGVAWVHHGLVSINSDKMSKSLPSHFIVGHMKQLSAIEYYMISTHSHPPMDYTSMLLGYGYKDQNASIFIFDPGGFRCWLSWLKMMKILEAYQNNGRNSEDYQIYVFDPGGPLIRLVMDAIPGMCYATSSFKHRLSLILEDKDRFKRRVLIHIKMRLRVAWSLYLLFLISQVINSLYKSISYLVIINQ